jgi:glyoxylase-like metal-dependent hydrolase (beta-lactamase superfamily II)
MPFITNPQSLSPTVNLIDVQGWDFPHTTSVLIVQGRETAVVETGHHRCGEQILTALKEQDISLEQLRFICVTHRHGDHCGGATPLAMAVSDAQVVGHKYAIATLREPDRLNAGARQLFGSYAQDIHPLPQEVETQEVHDGNELDLGRDVRLEVIGTPGHTSDHLAFFEQQSQILYTGDALGLLGPHKHSVTPASFPPSFNLPVYRESIARLRAYDPQFLVFSHFGAVTGADIPKVIDRALTTLDSWKDTVEETWQTTSSRSAVEQAIKERFLKELEVFPPPARPLFIQVMSQGLMRSLLPREE